MVLGSGPGIYLYSTSCITTVVEILIFLVYIRNTTRIRIFDASRDVSLHFLASPLSKNTAVDKFTGSMVHLFVLFSAYVRHSVEKELKGPCSSHERREHRVAHDTSSCSLSLILKLMM